MKNNGEYYKVSILLKTAQLNECNQATKTKAKQLQTIYKRVKSISEQRDQNQ